MTFTTRTPGILATLGLLGAESPTLTVVADAQHRVTISGAALAPWQAGDPRWVNTLTVRMIAAPVAPTITIVADPSVDPRLLVDVLEAARRAERRVWTLDLGGATTHGQTDEDAALTWRFDGQRAELGTVVGLLSMANAEAPAAMADLLGRLPAGSRTVALAACPGATSADLLGAAETVNKAGGLASIGPCPGLSAPPTPLVVSHPPPPGDVLRTTVDADGTVHLERQSGHSRISVILTPDHITGYLEACYEPPAPVAPKPRRGKPPPVPPSAPRCDLLVVDDTGTPTLVARRPPVTDLSAEWLFGRPVLRVAESGTETLPTPILTGELTPLVLPRSTSRPQPLGLVGDTPRPASTIDVRLHNGELSIEGQILALPAVDPDAAWTPMAAVKTRPDAVAPVTARLQVLAESGLTSLAIEADANTDFRAVRQVLASANDAGLERFWFSTGSRSDGQPLGVLHRQRVPLSPFEGTMALREGRPPLEVGLLEQRYFLWRRYPDVRVFSSSAELATRLGAEHTPGQARAPEPDRLIVRATDAQPLSRVLEVLDSARSAGFSTIYLGGGPAPLMFDPAVAEASARPLGATQLERRAYNGWVSLGGMDVAVFDAVYAADEAAVLACFRSTRRGILLVGYEVGNDGSVLRAELMSSNLNSPDADICLINRVRAWRFPPLPPQMIFRSAIELWTAPLM